jgi:hypothetical protein
VKTAENMFKIVPNNKAKELRQQFIEKYINTNTECYRHIRSIDTEVVVRNQTYFYLRDTLKDNKRFIVSYENALDALRKKAGNVYIMWDVSNPFEKGFENEDEKLLINHGYTCDTVLEMSSINASKMIEKSNDESKYAIYSDRVLPEDVYVFDENLSFYIAFTHSFLSWDGNVPKNRIVYSSIEMLS